jgi:hypothetical protein
MGIAMSFAPDVESLAPLRMHELSELVTASAWRERLMLLGAAGVTHVATMDDPDNALLSLARAVPTSAGTPMRVFRNRLALPRVRLVPTVKLHVGSGEFTRIIQEAPPDLFASATIVSRPDWTRFARGESPVLDAAPDWMGSARLVSEGASRLEIETLASGGGGYLVLSDAWIPGMSATVDDVSAAAFPADHAFMGVVVPEGRHVVRIEYCPWQMR